jgi:hypothetical protein
VDDAPDEAVDVDELDEASEDEPSDEEDGPDVASPDEEDALGVVAELAARESVR